MINRLLENIGVENFFKNFWGKSFAVFDVDKDFFPNFNSNDFFNILKRTHICFPQVSCINEHGQVPHQKYIKVGPRQFSAEVDFEAIKEVAAEKATIRIRNIPKYSESVALLHQKFVNSFKFKTTVNAYYSDTGSNGFNAHYDTRHTFILQHEGLKRWFFGEKINEIPRHDFTPHTKVMDGCKKNTIDLDMNQVLYIPPGLWHKTRTLEKSLHLAIGVTMPDWYDFMSGYLKYVMKKYDLMRQHLPFEVCEDKINFSHTYLNEHRNLIELLKNDIKKYDWFKFVHKIVDEKP
ncbi:MAG: hypothetical protein CMM87_00035 [Rickettsiales bacterium]|nr:hypothetical protein [Rickettsiales bacterium]|tara:strand:- start:2951 stop:3826 length:876 start_codon:yes stop_codon:yes gene_type:complete